MTTKPLILAAVAFSCAIFSGNPFPVTVSSSLLSTAQAEVTSDFDDLASNVAVVALGGINLSLDTTYGFTKGNKPKADQKDDDEALIIHKLSWSQNFRFQLDEGVDLGITLSEKFSSSASGARNTLFDSAKTDGDPDSMFVYGLDIVITNYYTQTLFTAVKVGGRGWMQQQATNQGMLSIGQDAALAAPIRNTGIFIRPEVGFVGNLIFIQPLNVTNIVDGREKYWLPILQTTLKFKLGSSYRHVFADLVTLEGAVHGFGNFTIQPRYLGDVSEQKQNDITEFFKGSTVAFPGAQHDGGGWEGGVNVQFKVRIDEKLLANYAPLSKLGFNLAYSYTKVNGDPRFNAGSHKHSFSFFIRCELF